MYQSNLHKLLIQTLDDITWTKSTKDEDNFRHVICSALYKFISPNCVEIPSTRSGRGDINIFGRKIELKYASRQKQVGIVSIIADCDRLLRQEVEFCIVSISLETDAEDSYVDTCIPLPVMNPATVTPDFGNTGAAPNIYRKVSLFLAATYPHFINITAPGAVGRPTYRYLSFEDVSAISRSSFLQTFQGLIHVDVIGSREDGLITFLYKRADQVQADPLAASPIQDIKIPSAPNPVIIGQYQLVDAVSRTQKTGATKPLGKKIVETGVPCFRIY